MTRTRLLVTVLAFAALAFVPFIVAPPQPAKAAATVLCQPNSVSSQVGSRVVTNPNTNNSYVLNSNGCAVFAQADVGYFIQFQGFAPGPPYGNSLLFTVTAWSGTTSFQIGQLPAATYIQHLICQETAGNTVTGGVNVGTSSGGSDIAAGANFACTANSLGFVKDASIAKRIFSTTAVQPIFVTPATAGNNATVIFTVPWGYF